MAEDFFQKLFNLIEDRKNSNSDESYVKSLFNEGSTKINEKVLEEALELLESASDTSEDKVAKIVLFRFSSSWMLVFGARRY